MPVTSTTYYDKVLHMWHLWTWFSWFCEGLLKATFGALLNLITVASRFLFLQLKHWLSRKIMGVYSVFVLVMEWANDIQKVPDMCTSVLTLVFTVWSRIYSTGENYISFENVSCISPILCENNSSFLKIWRWKSNIFATDNICLVLKHFDLLIIHINIIIQKGYTAGTLVWHCCCCCFVLSTLRQSKS